MNKYKIAHVAYWIGCFLAFGSMFNLFFGWLPRTPALAGFPIGIALITFAASCGHDWSMSKEEADKTAGAILHELGAVEAGAFMDEWRRRNGEHPEAVTR